MCKRRCHFDRRIFKNLPTVCVWGGGGGGGPRPHNLPRSGALLPRFGPWEKIVATPLDIYTCYYRVLELLGMKLLYHSVYKI